VLPRYPLAPLVDVRAIAREKADIEVARAARACEQAEFREAQVRRKLEAVRDSIAAERRASLLAAEQAPVTAQHLQLAEQRRLAGELQVERLSRELVQMRMIADEQRHSYVSAQRAAVRAHEMLAAVERHRTRFDQSAAKALEELREEDAAENWSARDRLQKPGPT
jgi:hypothetical protein